MKKTLIFLAVFGALLLAAHPVVAATNDNFIPLTNIPAITDISNTSDLASFFNEVYKIAIGAAAGLAVLMIMYAGILWMTAGDNTENISKARSRITGAVFGLILILSPAIVFQIVNPNILNLQLGFQNVSVSPAPANSTVLTAGTTWESSASDATAVCKQQGGTPSTVSTANGISTIRCTPPADTDTCPASFPEGTTDIQSNQQACCSTTRQAGCTLNVGSRGQYSCTCTAPATTP